MNPHGYYQDLSQSSYSLVTTNSGGPGTLTLSSPKPASTYDDDPISSSFLYPSSHVTVSLGRRMWGLKQPVYGFNGIVHGFVQLSKECTHVVRVEVSLVGRLKVTASDRGLVSEHVNRRLVTSEVVLSCPPHDGFTPTEESFSFSIPFPSQVTDGTSPLPPSCAWVFSTFSTEVEYSVRVNVHRKGLRRHELRTIPVLYLPKTWPSHSVPRRDAIFGLLPSSTQYKTVSLQPVWPHHVPPRPWLLCRQLSCSTRPTSHTPQANPFTKAYYPEQGVSRSGTTPHTRVGSPIGKVHHSAVPRWSGCWGREVVLSKGNITQTDTTEEGFAISYFDLTLGESGKEQSWSVEDDVKMTYLIRVSVSCPDSSINYLPRYNHASRIGVATEPAPREHGLLGFGGFSDPAIGIGMRDERLERGASHVNVG
ncbi:hypothetical protein BJV77DRAFT_1156858 [Russula vinacea]|nr:hypothetical protein BJV77DRAFT_1156858 [Russula vinacea]